MSEQESGQWLLPVDDERDDDGPEEWPAWIAWPLERHAKSRVPA